MCLLQQMVCWWLAIRRSGVEKAANSCEHDQNTAAIEVVDSAIRQSNDERTVQASTRSFSCDI